MTAYSLMLKHTANYPSSHFFDKETLKFFGERLSDMYVLKDTVRVTSAGGFSYECYVLSSLQRKAPGGPRRTYHYFDTKTYGHVIM